MEPLSIIRISTTNIAAFVCTLILTSVSLCQAEATAEGSNEEALRADARETFKNKVAPFVKTYCTRCHGGGRAKADLNLEVALKAPGRGAWITPDRAALEKAMADGHLRRGLMRAFKGGPEGVTLSYSDDLPQQIADALTRHVLDRLGLELRGGNIVLGAAKIEEHARTGRIALLLHASDASEDGRKKLDQAWRVGTENEGSGKRGMVLPLDREALSVALGRENVVHLGVSGRAASFGGKGRGGSAQASASGRIGQAATRLSRFLGSDPPE